MEIAKNGEAIRSVDDWFLYAPPKGQERHWQPGRSALECAKAWCGEGHGLCVPEEIASLLNSHSDTHEAELLKGTPEYQVRFDKLRGEPRNTDLALYARDERGAIAISIEAKVDERFGQTVQEIAADTIDELAHNGRSKLNTRIRDLAASLLPPPRRELPRLGDLRYQLLTATAGALAYATETGANRAVLIIHEFVTERTREARQKDNAQDVNRFVARLTDGLYTEITAAQLIGPLRVPGKPLFQQPVPFYIGKARRTLGSDPALRSG